MFEWFVIFGYAWFMCCVVFMCVLYVFVCLVVLDGCFACVGLFMFLLFVCLVVVVLCFCSHLALFYVMRFVCLIMCFGSAVVGVCACYIDVSLFVRDLCMCVLCMFFLLCVGSVCLLIFLVCLFGCWGSAFCCCGFVLCVALFVLF